MFYIVLACGAVVLVLVLLGIICFRKNYANNKYKVPTPVSLEQLTKNPIFERNSNVYVNPRLEKWDVLRNNIEFIKDIEDGKLTTNWHHSCFLFMSFLCLSQYTS